MTAFRTPGKRPGQANKLPGSRPYFTYTADPWDLSVIDDKTIPNLGMVFSEPGVNGVKVVGHGEQETVLDDAAFLLASRMGRERIPHDIEVTAFGKKVQDYLYCVEGTLGDYWLDVWTRVEWIHGRPVFSLDLEGYRKFHLQVLGIILPKGPHPEQLRLAPRYTSPKEA
jgi:hypothetical protein